MTVETVMNEYDPAWWRRLFDRLLDAREAQLCALSLIDPDYPEQPRSVESADQLVVYREAWQAAHDAKNKNAETRSRTRNHLQNVESLVRSKLAAGTWVRHEWRAETLAIGVGQTGDASRPLGVLVTAWSDDLPPLTFAQQKEQKEKQGHG